MLTDKECKTPHLLQIRPGRDFLMQEGCISRFVLLGQSVITRFRAQIEPDAPAILQVMVTAAKGGNIQAARLILERIIPPIKPTEKAIELPLMGDSLAEMGKAVLAGISVGKVAPTQGIQLIASIGALSRLIQIDELERRTLCWRQGG